MFIDCMYASHFCKQMFMIYCMHASHYCKQMFMIDSMPASHFCKQMFMIDCMLASHFCKQIIIIIFIVATTCASLSLDLSRELTGNRINRIFWEIESMTSLLLTSDLRALNFWNVVQKVKSKMVCCQLKSGLQSLDDLDSISNKQLWVVDVQFSSVTYHL